MFLDIFPHKSCYRPGESVRLTVELMANIDLNVRLIVSIKFLAYEVTRLNDTVRLRAGDRATTELSLLPPDRAPRGYGADLLVLDSAGRIIAEASTAFDVLEHWTQAPRYGFLSDFDPQRMNVGTTMTWLTRYHINGVQFYDWMYRHEQLLPPNETFTDPLGRHLSLDTVRRLIDAAHGCGIAAMPYTAVYAASRSFYEMHPDWALLDAEGRPIPFGDDFLMIMNPAPGSPWSDHLLAQFEGVLERTAFDGIHLDQYGEPKEGHDAQGRFVPLDGAFPAFIDATKQVVRRHRGTAGAVIFNAVRNWPIETLAPSEQDVVYIEVWPPYTSYEDLHRLIVEGQQLSGGKPVVLAAYADPAQERNVRLINAVIFASGGYHIELGEPGMMLADPYFPSYGQLSEELQRIMRSTYDFAVRYQNVLSLSTRDATSAYAGRVLVDGVNLAGEGSWNMIWPIVRESDHAVAVSLVNLPRARSLEWAQALPGDPPLQEDLAVRLFTDQPVERIWWATPDGDDPAAQPLTVTRGSEEAGAYVAFRVPSLLYWDLIVVELKPVER